VPLWKFITSNTVITEFRHCYYQTHYSINNITDVLLFSGDISVLIFDNYYYDFKQKVNLTLSSVNRWFDTKSITFKYYENKHN
jgi:hypothetical protein